VSIAAAIGYAIGIIIFALIIRRNRSRMIDKDIAKQKAKLQGSGRGKQHD